jgi:hypothetical protein
MQAIVEKGYPTRKVHVGCVLNPNAACRNGVTLSVGRHGPRQRIQPGLGMLEQNELENSISIGRWRASQWGASP